ncbi:unnamed protein product, partial [Didymodactylos carnosus]
MPERFKAKQIVLPQPIYVETEDQFEQMLKIIEQEEIVGIDCERRDTYFEPRTALIQISSKDRDYLIFNNNIDPTLVSKLNRVTLNENIIKVIQDVRQDSIYLQKDFQIEFKNVFDTELAAGIINLDKTNYSFLLQHYLSINVYVARKFKNNFQHVINEENKRRSSKKERLLQDLNDEQLAKLQEIIHLRFDEGRRCDVIECKLLPNKLLLKLIELSYTTSSEIRNLLQQNSYCKLDDDFIDDITSVLCPNSTTYINGFSEELLLQKRKRDTSRESHTESTTEIQLKREKRQERGKKKLDFNLFICGLPWRCP